MQTQTDDVLIKIVYADRRERFVKLTKLREEMFLAGTPAHIVNAFSARILRDKHVTSKSGTSYGIVVTNEDDDLLKWIADNKEMLGKIEWRFIVRTSTGYWGKGETLEQALRRANWKLTDSFIVGLYDSDADVDEHGTVKFYLGQGDIQAVSLTALGDKGERPLITIRQLLHAAYDRLNEILTAKPEKKCVVRLLSEINRFMQDYNNE